MNKKIILAIIVGIFLISFVTAWPYGFSYRKLVNISNTAGELTDFQVAINMTEVDLNLTGLVGSWHFNEGSGNKAGDSSGEENDGKIKGNILYVSYSMAASANSYRYEDITSVANYVIQSGDYLEYDVYWTSATDKIAVDYKATNNLRDSGALDQNGVSVHPTTDISAYALNKWYSRKIDLPVAHVGQTIVNYDVACENDDTAIKTAYLKNIRITNGAGTIRKIIYNGVAFTHAPHLSSSGEIVHFQNVHYLDYDYGYVSSTWGTGVESYAIEFDGIDDHIWVGTFNNVPSSTMSICSWINNSGDGAQDMIAQQGRSINDADTEYFFRVLTGKINFLDYDAGYGFGPTNLSDTNVNDSNWHYVCFTKSGVNGIFYLDSFPDGTATAVKDCSYSSNDFVIGQDYRDFTSAFNGTMDEVRVYDRVLSGAEINKSFCIGAYRLNHSSSYSFDYPSWCDDYIKSKYYSWQDLRFTNASGEVLKSGTTFSHWIENDKTAWVKVPLLANNANTTIYMNYGVTSMSSESDGDATFIFFDDFEDNSLDSSKWTTVSGGGGSIAETSREMQITSDGTNRIFLRSQSSFSAPYILELKAKKSENIEIPIHWDGAVTGAYDIIEDGYYAPWYLSWSALTTLTLTETVGGVQTRHDNYTITLDANYHDYKVVVNSSGDTIKVFYDDSLVLNTTDATRTSGYIALSARETPAALNAYYDNFIVRKYAISDPVVSFMDSLEERPAHRNPFTVSVSSHLKFAGSGFGFKIRSPVIA